MDETQGNTALTMTEQQAVALSKLSEIGAQMLVLTDSEKAMEVVRENLDGLNTQFDRIKIPSGGGIAFEITDESGEAKAVSEVAGVILDHYAVNAYWNKKFTGENNPPDCVAMDGKQGVVRPEFVEAAQALGITGTCASCPLNQWGSDQQKDGTMGAGKACKNIHRVYVVPTDSIFPYQIALPPTSLRNLTDYMKRLGAKLKPFYSVLTKIKLQKAQNKGGIVYSQAVFAKAGDLAPNEAINIKRYAETLKPVMRQVKIEAADYEVSNVEPVEGGSEGGVDSGPDKGKTAGNEPW